MKGTDARSREAIVLAGGFGTRLAGVVSDVPKPMAPVANRPFLRFILDILAEQRFRRVVIADGYKRECIEGYFGDCYRGVEIAYSSEEAPLFTGGAVKKALGQVKGDWVYVFNGDTFLDVGFGAFEEARRLAPTNVTCLIAAKTMYDFDRYGTMEIDAASGAIIAFREKAHRKTGIVNAGCYLMRTDALACMPEAFSLETEYFEQVVATGALQAVMCEGTFIDIGVPEDYERAQQLLAPRANSWRLALFDRDGTINVDTGHTHEPSELRLIESTVQVLREYANKPEWKVVVVTNQSGIARGLYTADQMRDFHDALDAELARFGARIDAYYHCPHHPDFTGPCTCRKPAPGMLEKALFDFEAEPSACVMYGDKSSDEAAAQAAGIAYYPVDDAWG